MAQSEFWFEDGGSEAPRMRGPGVAVAFSRGRGYSHSLRIEMGLSAAETGLQAGLVQAASAPDEESEPSGGRRIGNPVYQELVAHEQAHQRHSGLCALLTGSCFDHHFSAVFSLGRDPDAAEQVVFEIDVADRCRGPVEKLAATYVVSCPGGAIEAKSASASLLAFRLGSQMLELVAVPPAIIEVPRSSSEGMRVQIQATIDPNTHTQRLHYRWRWASCADRTRLTA